jgi:hypothetical protein
MKLDINEINHNHIVKVVIFALFMYKRQIRNTPMYRISVLKFIKARIPWKIDLLIETEEKLDKLQEREIILAELLDGLKSDYLTKINVTFTTPLKTVTMEIDLNDEKKYEKFLYM